MSQSEPHRGSNTASKSDPVAVPRPVAANDADENSMSLGGPVVGSLEADGGPAQSRDVDGGDSATGSPTARQEPSALYIDPSSGVYGSMYLPRSVADDSMVMAAGARWRAGSQSPGPSGPGATRDGGGANETTEPSPDPRRDTAPPSALVSGAPSPGGITAVPPQSSHQHGTATTGGRVTRRATFANAADLEELVRYVQYFAFNPGESSTERDNLRNAVSKHAKRIEVLSALERQPPEYAGPIAANAAAQVNTAELEASTGGIAGRDDGSTTRHLLLFLSGIKDMIDKSKLAAADPINAARDAKNARTQLALALRLVSVRWRQCGFVKGPQSALLLWAAFERRIALEYGTMPFPRSVAESVLRRLGSELHLRDRQRSAPAVAGAAQPKNAVDVALKLFKAHRFETVLLKIWEAAHRIAPSGADDLVFSHGTISSSSPLSRSRLTDAPAETSPYWFAITSRHHGEEGAKVLVGEGDLGAPGVIPPKLSIINTGFATSYSSIFTTFPARGDSPHTALLFAHLGRVDEYSLELAISATQEQNTQNPWLVQRYLNHHAQSDALRVALRTVEMVYGPTDVLVECTASARALYTFIINQFTPTFLHAWNQHALFEYRGVVDGSPVSPTEDGSFMCQQVRAVLRGCGFTDGSQQTEGCQMALWTWSKEHQVGVRAGPEVLVPSGDDRTDDATTRVGGGGGGGNPASSSSSLDFNCHQLLSTSYSREATLALHAFHHTVLGANGIGWLVNATDVVHMPSVKPVPLPADQVASIEMRYPGARVYMADVYWPFTESEESYEELPYAAFGGTTATAHDNRWNPRIRRIISFSTLRATLLVVLTAPQLSAMKQRSEKMFVELLQRVASTIFEYITPCRDDAHRDLAPRRITSTGVPSFHPFATGSNAGHHLNGQQIMTFRVQPDAGRTVCPDGKHHRDAAAAADGEGVETNTDRQFGTVVVNHPGGGTGGGAAAAAGGGNQGHHHHPSYSPEYHAKTAVATSTSLHRRWGTASSAVLSTFSRPPHDADGTTLFRRVQQPTFRSGVEWGGSATSRHLSCTLAMRLLSPDVWLGADDAFQVLEVSVNAPLVQLKARREERRHPQDKTERVAMGRQSDAQSRTGVVQWTVEVLPIERRVAAGQDANNF